MWTSKSTWVRGGGDGSADAAVVVVVRFDIMIFEGESDLVISATRYL